MFPLGNACLAVRSEIRVVVDVRASELYRKCRTKQTYLRCTASPKWKVKENSIAAQTIKDTAVCHEEATSDMEVYVGRTQAHDRPEITAETVTFHPATACPSPYTVM
ncbi:hypothetical protein CBL_11067 [Carabus blaptoides fortunei]